MMLMTVWAFADVANPKAAIPARRLIFNFMAFEEQWLVSFVVLIGCRGTGSRFSIHAPDRSSENVAVRR